MKRGIHKSKIFQTCMKVLMKTFRGSMSWPVSSINLRAAMVWYTRNETWSQKFRQSLCFAGYNLLCEDVFFSLSMNRDKMMYTQVRSPSAEVVERESERRHAACPCPSLEPHTITASSSRHETSEPQHFAQSHRKTVVNDICLRTFTFRVWSCFTPAKPISG